MMVRLMNAAKVDGFQLSRWSGWVSDSLAKWPGTAKQPPLALADDLAQVVSEAIFDIPRLVEAARH